MENKKWKRFGSCLMALAMVLSGTALPASAATPGKDGDERSVCRTRVPDADRPLFQRGHSFGVDAGI